MLAKWRIISFVLFYVLIFNNATWAEGKYGCNNYQQKQTANILSEKISTATQEDFDVIHYHLELAIIPETEWVDGELKLTATSMIDDLVEVVLNFTSFLRVNSVKDSGISFVHNKDLLTIKLNRNYNRGEAITVAIKYSGQPTLALDPGGLFFARRGATWAIHSESCPWHARNWFPCKDVPWDKADSTDMIITVPEDLVVASNGLMRRLSDNGDGTKTYHWHEDYPISTYLISIQITDYSIFQDWYVNAHGDSMPLIHFAYPRDLDKAQFDWVRTVDMMEFFVSLFGEYPFFDEKYGMAEYNAIWGGMENQTLTSIYDGNITGSGNQDALVAHELAHQWWGDCITMADWGHTWLNEGFATYCESLWWEYVDGDSGLKLTWKVI